MYVIEFFKRIFKMKNWGILLYLVINIVVVVIIFANFFVLPTQIDGGETTPVTAIMAFIFGIIMYIISISIALSPIGEWLLRKLNKCEKITRKEDLDRLKPLFHEVYERAQILDPSISPNIQLYINDDKEPNAFATGRNTICLTRGLLEYSDDEIKAIFAHEFGHLHHKDTDLILLITVGNFIINIMFVLIRILTFVLGFILAMFAGGSRRRKRRWDGSYEETTDYTSSIAIVVILDAILVGLFNIWTKIGTLLVLQSNRSQEFEADSFANDTGYGYDLAEALDHLDGYSGEKSKGLFLTLMSTHPSTDQRIAKLQELGVPYERIN